MLVNKLAFTLLGAATIVAALPTEERDKVELARHFDSDVEVAKRAPILGERQGGTGGDSGGNCGHDGHQNYGNMYCGGNSK